MALCWAPSLPFQSPLLSAQPHPFLPCPVLPSCPPVLPSDPPCLPLPLLLLGMEIAFQLPFAFPINPDSAIKPAAELGGRRRLQRVLWGCRLHAAPIPPQIVPAPSCAQPGWSGRELDPWSGSWEGDWEAGGSGETGRPAFLGVLPGG